MTWFAFDHLLDIYPAKKVNRMAGGLRWVWYRSTDSYPAGLAVAIHGIGRNSVIMQ